METIISKETINYEPTWTPEQLKNAVVLRVLTTFSRRSLMILLLMNRLGSTPFSQKQYLS